MVADAAAFSVITVGMLYAGATVPIRVITMARDLFIFFVSLRANRLLAWDHIIVGCSRNTSSTPVGKTWTSPGIKGPPYKRFG